MLEGGILMTKVRVIYNNQSLEVNVIRFFKKENQVYLVYSLLEKDENEYIKLYVTKIYNQSGQLIGVGITEDQEWNLVKSEIQDIIRANRENLQPNITDLDSSILNNLRINDRRAFKLLEQSINLLEKKNVVKNDNDSYEQLYLKEQQTNIALMNKVNAINKKFEELRSEFNSVLEAINSDDNE